MWLCCLHNFNEFSAEILWQHAFAIANSQHSHYYSIMLVDNPIGVGIVGIARVLMTIGFEAAADRGSIMESGIREFEDFHCLVEKDIWAMSDKFGMLHRVANGKIVLIRLGHTKNLTWVVHWVQDCHQVYNIPDHNDFSVKVLYQLLSLVQIRKSDMDLVATNSKAADPVKFIDEALPLSSTKFLQIKTILSHRFVGRFCF